MNLEEILAQAATARPGYELAAFKEAGLPVYLLTVRVLTLDHKPLSPIDEGVLKAVSAGLDTPDDIAAFLGLPSNVLTPAFVGLNTLELINYMRAVGEGTPRVSVTIKGRNALAVASTITPQEKTVRICLDAITRQLLFVSPNALYKPRDMRERGLFEVPSGASKRPEVEDISMEDFDRVLARQRAGRENASDLLSVRRVERRELHYLPCILMFYRNQTRTNEVDVAFWREDGPSLDHEARFRELGGQDLVGAKFLVNKSAAPAPDVVEQVSDYSKPADTVVVAPSIEPASLSTPASYVQDTKPVVSGETLQQILCHEHPGLLTKALLHSKRRLLIISPWIRHQVVNFEFVASLEALLKKGVDVYIGYGLDEQDGGGRNKDAARKPPITPTAEKDLKGLAAKYKNFRFVYVGNTHRKSLVSDDSFAVVTSFNWLSFKGMPSDKPRDESGVVIRKKAYIDMEFEKGMTLLQHGYKGESISPRSG